MFPDRTLTSARVLEVNRMWATSSDMDASIRPRPSERSRWVAAQPIGNGCSLHANGNDTRLTVRAEAGPATSKATRGFERLPDSHAPALGTIFRAAAEATGSIVKSTRLIVPLIR